MWRIVSFITAFLSITGVLFFWRKHKRIMEDDHYYCYGDSLYQELTEPEYNGINSRAEMIQAPDALKSNVLETPQSQ